MSRNLRELDIEQALDKQGYKTVEDVTSTLPRDLAVDLGIGLRQAEDILRTLNQQPPRPPCHSTPAKTVTASQLLKVLPTYFSTLSVSLDKLIGYYVSGYTAPHGLNLKSRGRDREDSGSIRPGAVIELSGPPGGGKTGTIIGIALSARILDGGGGPPEVLLIDTEGSISADRLRLAAESVGDADSILEGIHVMRVGTQLQMITVIHMLDSWLTDHREVKLVLIDTLSYHFRQPSLDLNTRRRVMEQVKTVFGKAATVHGCAVIASTQMATKLMTNDNKPATFETGDRAVLMPQLGDAWTTERTIRVTLFRGAKDDLRYAHASCASQPIPSQEEVPWASFDIDNYGLLCDIPPS